MCKCNANLDGFVVTLRDFSPAVDDDLVSLLFLPLGLATARTEVQLLPNLCNFMHTSMKLFKCYGELDVFVDLLRAVSQAVDELESSLYPPVNLLAAQIRVLIYA